MKKFLLAAAIVALPVAANAQSDWFANTQPTYQGFYIGAEGAANWLLNNNSYQMDTGWAAGGKIGYDFVGPRVELEALYHSNTGTGVVAFPTGYAKGTWLPETKPACWGSTHTPSWAEDCRSSRRT